MTKRHAVLSKTFLAVVLAGFGAGAAAATFTVTNASDSGAGSLRHPQLHGA